MLLPRRFRSLLLVTAALVAVVAAACGGDDKPAPTPTLPPGRVSVLGLWDGEELASFRAMTAPWEQGTGGKVEFAGTRDITAILRARVESDTPPDIALPAEVGLFEEFARAGKLAPLSACEGLEQIIRDNYPQSFIDLGTVDGTLYGFFMKADTKATIWYDPQVFAANNLQPLDASARYDDLVPLSERIRALGIPPWSNGQKANGGTGFPGSDTIQQILAGEDLATYDAVAAGDVPYTDPRVRAAWQEFGRLALTAGYTAQGSGEAVASTPFRDSVYPPFQDPPGAAMVHMGGFAAAFIAEQYPQAVPGRDFDFFPWPGGAVTGGANIAYAFNSDPGTCSLLKYLAGAEAQQVWVERGGFTSVNRQVSLDAYPDQVTQAQAEQLLNATVFRFDMDDVIGGAGQQAIFQGVIRYLQDPSALDSILRDIDAAIRSGAPATPH